MIENIVIIGAGNGGKAAAADLALQGKHIRLFEFPEFESVDILPGCRCHEVILGMIDPVDCALFGKRCTIENPYGPCMVGHEGTCRIRFDNLE